MATEIFNASAGDVVVDHFLVIEGGTSGVDEASAREGIDAIAAALKGKSQGPVPLDANRFIPAEHLSDLNPTAISINGPLIVECGTTRIYQVTNYDSYSSYAVSAESGSVVMEDNHVFYTAPVDEGPCGFSVNGRFISITAVEGLIHTPTVVTPAENFVPLTGNFVVTGSPFTSTDTGAVVEVFTSADLEISVDPEFKTLDYAEYGSPSSTFNVTGFKPENDTYVRIRYHGIQRVSEWSPVLKLKGVLQYVKKPVISTPVSGQSAGYLDASDPKKQKVVLDVASSVFEAVNYTDSFQSIDVEISTTMDFANIVHAAYGYTTASDTYSGLAKLDYGTLYYLRVRHHGTQKTSVWSDVVWFTTIADSRSVQKPTFVSANPVPTEVSLGYKVTMSTFSSTNQDTIASSKWQIATDPGFTNLVADVTDTNEVLDLVHLPYSTDFYLRVKYIGQIKESPWSDTIQFKTVSDDRVVSAPTFTAPTAGQTDFALTGQAKTTAFASGAVSTTFNDTHVSTSWEVATDSAFTSLVMSKYNDTVNKTTLTLSGLNYLGNYYIRSKYHGAVKSSDWSSAVNFKVMADNRAIQTPSVDVSGGQLADTKPMITGTAFTPQNYTDTHVSTDWQIATDAGFTNIVASSVGNTVSKTQWQPTVSLSNDTVYYARALYNGSVKSSGYSTAKQFKTVPAGMGITTLYTSSQSVAKPSGVTQVRFQLVGGGGGGTGYSGYPDQSAMEYGTAGEYKDMGWVDIASASSSFGLNIPEPLWIINQESGFAKGQDGGETIVSGLLSYSAKGGIGAYAANTSGLTSIPSAFPIKNGSNYGDGALGVGRGYSPNTVYSSPGGRGAVAITFDTEKAPNTPTLYVSGGNSSVSLSPSFSSTSYTTSDRFPNHVSSDWEIATDSGFTNIVKSTYNDTVNKSSWSTSGLGYSSTYFVRVRHRSRYSVSNWSTGVYFTTKTGVALSGTGELKHFDTNTGDFSPMGIDPGYFSPNTYVIGATASWDSFRISGVRITPISGTTFRFDIMSSEGGVDGGGPWTYTVGDQTASFAIADGTAANIKYARSWYGQDYLKKIRFVSFNKAANVMTIGMTYQTRADLEGNYLHYETLFQVPLVP